MQTHLAHGPGSLHHQEKEGQRNNVQMEEVGGIELLRPISMNEPLNLNMYIEQRRTPHENLHMHRHPWPWTAPD